LAWRNGRWDSVDHFRRVQRKWAIWGLVIWIAVAGFFAAIFGGVFSALRYSEAYTMATAELQANPVATSILGSPISAGWPTGSISVQGSSSGNAELTFSASGPKAAGTVTALAVKKNGVWSLTRLTLTPDGGKAIDLIGGVRPNTT
jgi:Cytochrome oxidase complex assembly protein 1